MEPRPHHSARPSTTARTFTKAPPNLLRAGQRRPCSSSSEMDELRRQARRLENALDAKLVQFGRLDGGGAADERAPCCASTLEASSSAEQPTASIQSDIEQMLMELSEVNDRMCRQAPNGSGGGGTAAAMHVLQRHREILHDFMQEFNKTKANLKSADERQQLLSSVRQDICDHRSTSSRATDTLLRERNAIHTNERLVDEVLGQADASKQALAAQRSVMGGVGSKLQLLSSVAPQVNALIGSIARRKKRDKMILGVLIGCCTSFLLLYSVS